jgi:CMD domain protein
MSEPQDIIDFLAGIEPGSRLDALRAERPQARENAQKSYRALFEAGTPGSFTPEERHAVAAFVAGLHREAGIARFYAAGSGSQSRSELSAAIEAETTLGATQGPYGRYEQGPLAGESRDGLRYAVASENEARLGRRLAAALQHAHLLVFHPRDAAPQNLKALLDAGWTSDEVVTLSQLISFLTFQIRVVVGLKALAEAPSIRPASVVRHAGQSELAPASN